MHSRDIVKDAPESQGATYDRYGRRRPRRRRGCTLRCRAVPRQVRGGQRRDAPGAALPACEVARLRHRRLDRRAKPPEQAPEGDLRARGRAISSPDQVLVGQLAPEAGYEARRPGNGDQGLRPRRGRRPHDDAGLHPVGPPGLPDPGRPRLLPVQSGTCGEVRQLWKYLRLLLPPEEPRSRARDPRSNHAQAAHLEPAHDRYWSQTPYKLGDEAVVKYSARPEPLSLTARLLSRDTPLFPRSANMFALLIGNPERDHALEDAMAHRLSPGAPPVRFDFQVQLQPGRRRDADRGPAERMEGARLPVPTVATIEIPAQEFTSQRRRNAAEALTFTPEHALPSTSRRALSTEFASRSTTTSPNAINGVRRSEPRSRDEWLSSAAARVPP